MPTRNGRHRGGDSSSSHGGVVVNPDGTISYNFDGHVLATGLDLLADSGGSPEDRKVRWLRDTDRAPSSYIAGADDGANNQSILVQTNQNNYPFVTAGVSAHGSIINGQPGVYVQLRDDGVTVRDSRVLAAAGDVVVIPGQRGNQRTIIGYDVVAGRVVSDFVNALAETGLKVIRGVINTAGAGSIVKGAGFSIVRNAAGAVTVTFTSPFSDVPAVLLTAVVSATNNFIEHAQAVTANTFKGQVVSDAGAASDAVFHFLAIGPQ